MSLEILLGVRPPAEAIASAIAGRSNGSMFYYTYVLRSEIDNKLYIGWTNDIKKRVVMHNKGLVESTKHRIPLKLVYYEACLSKTNAISREKQLKTGFGRAFLDKRI